MSPIGRNADGRARAAFTLIELILVMAMILAVVGVAAPLLGGFFKGRVLDSEARRFVALTRQAQSRAVSDGLPVLLWIDSDSRRYGLETQLEFLDSSTLDQAGERVDEFELDQDVTMEVLTPLTASLERGSAQSTARRTVLRFTPDGFIGEANPEGIILTEKRGGEIWIMPDLDRLRYEVQTNIVEAARR